MPKFSRPIFACLALFALCSCSRIKLAYNYADWILERQAHQYLQLNSLAEEKFSEDLKAYLTWHRKEMLPTYSALLRRIAKGFRGEEDEAENIRLVTPMLSGVWADTVEPAIVPVSEALSSLNEYGILYLEKAYADDSVRQRKLYLEDPAAADQRRIDRVIGYVKDFAGSVTSEQKKKIAEITLAVHMPYAEWVQDREQRKKDLVALLREHKSRQVIEAALRDWWLRPRVGSSQARRGQMNMDEVKVFFLECVKMLTPEQRENAARTMEDYARQFDELARDVAGPQPKPTAAPAPVGPKP